MARNDKHAAYDDEIESWRSLAEATGNTLARDAIDELERTRTDLRGTTRAIGGVTDKYFPDVTEDDVADLHRQRGDIRSRYVV